MLLVVDVRSVEMKKKKLKVNFHGWTAIPVFTFDGYVKAERFQMPLFQGSPSTVCAV